MDQIIEPHEKLCCGKQKQTKNKKISQMIVSETPSIHIFIPYRRYKASGKLLLIKIPR